MSNLIDVLRELSLVLEVGDDEGALSLVGSDDADVARQHLSRLNEAVNDALDGRRLRAVQKGGAARRDLLAAEHRVEEGRLRCVRPGELNSLLLSFRYKENIPFN